MKINIFGWSFTNDSAMKAPETKSFVEGNQSISNGSTTVRSYSFNGEKNAGELGAPINIIPDYRSLRFRAYEQNLTSDVVKIITGKFFKWVVGSGLKLQAEPNEKILKLEKVDVDLLEFVSNVECYYDQFADSISSDYSGMCNLHDNASKAYETAFLGGDCLVILRLDDKLNVTVQVVDGQHVETPIFQGNFLEDAKKRGNVVRHGIEMNPKGEHVAFFVKKDTGSFISEYERVLATGENSGMLMAWMVYSSKHRIDHNRGISQLSSILEKVQKLDRYTEAMVSAAEERAKVPWFFKHSRFSDGENPLLIKLKGNTGADVLESSHALGETLSQKIAVTENKQVYNLPIDSDMKALESNAENNYDTFFQAIFVQLCASLDAPPEVALQKYNSNYSASRAAINGWGYIVNIHRKKFSNSFYQPIYNFWLYVHILKSKVDANGYLSAVNSGNEYILSSYSKARFTGANMPHIDPKKEAEAIRVMLGDASKGEAPLMTNAQATEQLGNGEFSENMKKYKEENKLIDQPKIDKNAVDPKVKK